MRPWDGDWRVCGDIEGTAMGGQGQGIGLTGDEGGEARDSAAQEIGVSWGSLKRPGRRRRT